MRRVLVTVLVATIVCLLPARPASAATAEEAAMVADINSLRTRLGHRPLELHPELEHKAETWAAHLAELGTPLHSPATDGITVKWVSLAENVAVAVTTEAGQARLLASTVHYGNIVNPDFTHIGVGIAAAGGQVFVVQEFMELRKTRTTVPSQPPSTTSTTAPVRASATTAAIPTQAPASAPRPPTSPPAPSALPAPPPALPASPGDGIVQAAPSGATPVVAAPPAIPAAQTRLAGRRPAGKDASAAGAWTVVGLVTAGGAAIFGRDRLRRRRAAKRRQRRDGGCG